MFVIAMGKLDSAKQEGELYIRVRKIPVPGLVLGGGGGGDQSLCKRNTSVREPRLAATVRRAWKILKARSAKHK